MAKKVIKIEPVRQKVIQQLRPKKRVCAYCRVSTDSAKQHTSYVAQVEYYKAYIEKRKDWEFAGIFADEAKSGTQVGKREEFLRMMKECENGNIDIIITKSVTRFARNTIDSIEAIRKLKSLGITIYFEKENISTISEQSEQMLTILSSLAQGESESISTNNRWGIQKRFRDGSYNISCVAYGYTKNENGEITIKEDEAKIVRRIYSEYLNGKGSFVISRDLTKDNIPPVRTAEKWNDCVVKDILQNPIYEGDLILQKTYTTEALPFTKKRNRGEMPQFFIKDNHEPIITREQGEMVREILEYRRKQMGMDDSSGKYQNRYEFSSKIMCRECGGNFRRQKIYIGKPSEKIKWKCKKYIFQNSVCCKNQFYTDSQLMAIFIAATNELIKKKWLLEKVPKKKPLKMTLELSQTENRIKELEQEELFSSLELAELVFKRAELIYKGSKIDDHKSNTEKIKEALAGIEKITEFDEELFETIIKQITVYQDTKVDVEYINGTIISRSLENRGKDEKHGSYEKDSSNNTASNKI